MILKRSDMTITSYLEAWFKIVTVYPKAMFMWNMSQVSLKGEKKMLWNVFNVGLY